MGNYKFLKLLIIVFSILFISCGLFKKTGKRKKISSQNIELAELANNNQNWNNKYSGYFDKRANVVITSIFLNKSLFL